MTRIRRDRFGQQDADRIAELLHELARRLQRGWQPSTDETWAALQHVVDLTTDLEQQFHFAAHVELRLTGLHICSACDKDSPSILTRALEYLKERGHYGRAIGDTA